MTSRVAIAKPATTPPSVDSDTRLEVSPDGSRAVRDESCRIAGLYGGGGLGGGEGGGGDGAGTTSTTKVRAPTSRIVTDPMRVSEARLLENVGALTAAVTDSGVIDTGAAACVLPAPVPTGALLDRRSMVTSSTVTAEPPEFGLTLIVTSSAVMPGTASALATASA